MCLYSVDFNVFHDLAFSGLVTQLTGTGGMGLHMTGTGEYGFEDDGDGRGWVWK